MSAPDRGAVRDALRDVAASLAALERACDRHEVVELDGWAPLPTVAELAVQIAGVEPVAPTARYLLLDDTEHDLITSVLDDAASDGHQDHADAWRAGFAPRGEAIVHGLTDAGHLLALPPTDDARRWMTDRLHALAAAAHHGRVLGWAPRYFADRLAARIENEDLPAGEPGSVRVGADDLRVLLDAAEGAAGRSPQTDADRAWIDAIADVVDRVGTLAAHTWTDHGQ